MKINYNNIAIIFDMDGVIIDSNPYHKQAWAVFCEKYGLKYSDNDFEEHFCGRNNEDILSYVFKKNLTKTEIDSYSIEKELLFQKCNEPYTEPIAGLVEFLELLNSNNIKKAVATSAPTTNVDFILNKLDIRKFFQSVIDISCVTKGKPNPEIYLKAASSLNIVPNNCLVFEDSLPGIQAAKNAGMRVIALTTTHSKEEFSDLVDFVISDFTQIDLIKIFSILGENG